VAVYFRRRDEYGRLLRPGELLPGQAAIPEGEAVSFEAMFRQVWANHGRSEEEIERRWQAYLDENPRLRLMSAPPE
jgi:hypothetical protein